MIYKNGKLVAPPLTVDKALRHGRIRCTKTSLNVTENKWYKVVRAEKRTTPDPKDPQKLLIDDIITIIGDDGNEIELSVTRFMRYFDYPHLCECGGDKANCGHSSWCDKGKQNI